MTKDEYIEYCRQLFGNPLFLEGEIRIDEYGGIYTNVGTAVLVTDEKGYERWYQSNHDYHCIGIPDSEFNFPWQESLVSRSDFEQGGKYYKENEDGA